MFIYAVNLKCKIVKFLFIREGPGIHTNKSLSIISIILNQIDGIMEEEENEEDLAVKHIKKYIDEHYLEDLTLEEISETLNVSSLKMLPVMLYSIHYESQDWKVSISAYKCTI